MSRPFGTVRRGRGTLVVLGGLFLASGLVRLADGTGRALAREAGAIASRQGLAETAATVAGCTTEDGLAEALTALRARSATLDERERQIEHRMIALKRAGDGIEQDLAALAAAEDSLAATIALADGVAADDIARLTAVYERMKPKDAAAVFDAMDPSFAAGFMARMRPDAAAAVMAGLSPAKAYAVSVLLASRNAAVPTD